MKDKQLLWLEDTTAKHSDLTPLFLELENLYERKLWHQITLKLEEEALAAPQLTQKRLLLPFYQNFVAGFAHKLNPLRLAKIAVSCAKSFEDDKDAGFADVEACSCWSRSWF